jgi:hypothetical protein
MCSACQEVICCLKEGDREERKKEKKEIYHFLNKIWNKLITLPILLSIPGIYLLLKRRR